MLKFFLSSVSMLSSTAAAAQKASPTTTSKTPIASTATDGGISDTVVTASRRAENVQRAALSIQTLSNEALARANVNKPEDLSQSRQGFRSDPQARLRRLTLATSPPPFQKAPEPSTMMIISRGCGRSNDSNWLVSGFVRNIWNEAVQAPVFPLPLRLTAQSAGGSERRIFRIRSPTVTNGIRIRRNF